MIYPYRPYGAARELFRQRGDELLLSGPAGTGKSRALLERGHAIATKYPGSRGLLLRKTRASLTTTGIVTYQRIVLPPGNAIVTQQGARYPNGSEIVFGGCDKWSKIMSSEYDWAYWQEANEGTLAEWEAVTTRLRWWHMPYQQMMADCNPQGPRHWLKDRCNQGVCTLLESRHQDNPALWDSGYSDWTPEGRKYIEKLDKLTGVRYKRIRMGIWAAAEGMVYEWDPDVHMIDNRVLPREWPRIWAVDFGYTNPFCWQAWCYDPDGRMILERQIYMTKRIVQDHARDIMRAAVELPKPVAIICDHDAEDRATLERELNMQTAAAHKAIKPGIDAVQKRLRVAGDGRPRIQIMRDALYEIDEDLVEAHLPKCTEEEWESYVWAINISGVASAKEVPVDKDNHGMDTCRYAVAFVDGLAADPHKYTSHVVYSEPVIISAY